MTDHKKILVIGSGPIIIGQAAEFDYSGSQCLQVLQEQNIESVILNSNPATIMTDEFLASKVYMEPMSVDVLKEIIIKEKPNALMCAFGGQTSLNLTKSIADSNFLKEHNVEILGSSLETIKLAEDRQLFRNHMIKNGFPVPNSEIVSSLNEGIKSAEKLGYPVVVRPAFTLGGSGGGIVHSEEELSEILVGGLELSPVSQCLIEQSILGFKEIEFEVIRDHSGSALTICGMENIDPVGVHTGDSIVVTPIQTLSDKDLQMLRSVSLNIAHCLNIIGGCNVQLAIDPQSSSYYVIEVNPRVSRSSALASKATGYPIAKIVALVCLGKKLNEILNPITGCTFASTEPVIDYVVIKIPRWPFDKFNKINRTLGTQMKATGEVMSLGRSFEEALQKGIRSLEIETDDLYLDEFDVCSKEELLAMITTPTDQRLWQIAAAFRKFATIDEVKDATAISTFFLNKIQKLVDTESEIKKSVWDKDSLLKWKQLGFSDKTIARLRNINIADVRKQLKEFLIQPVIKSVDTCSAEFVAKTPYYYQTFEEYDEYIPMHKKSILILGSGPIRIGQGIEFDYASVHALIAAKESGFNTIIVNNNPETCSTDFSYSDQLYFEPLHEDDIYYLLHRIKPFGVLVQFGGQTALNLASEIHSWGFNILGTSSLNISRVENRNLFDMGLETINVARPKGLTISNISNAKDQAHQIQYPVIVRPSFVLGGRQMSVCFDEEDLIEAISRVTIISEKFPLLIDKYIKGKEVEVDVLSDGNDIFIPGIMEHIESSGVHSGDSILVYPALNIKSEIKKEIVEISKKIAREFQLIGMFNIQFVINDGNLFLLEVNPRSSRTVPFISKMTSVNIAQLATRICLGQKISELNLRSAIIDEPTFFSVKVPVFSFEKISGWDPALEPEMKSTGEVLGKGNSLEEAIFKGMQAAGINIPLKGKILVLIDNIFIQECLETISEYCDLGFHIFTSKEISTHLKSYGSVRSESVSEYNEGGQDNIYNSLLAKKISLVINIFSKGKVSNANNYKIRRISLEKNIPCFTSIDTASALINVIKYIKQTT